MNVISSEILFAFISHLPILMKEKYLGIYSKEMKSIFSPQYPLSIVSQEFKQNFKVRKKIKDHKI